MSQPVDSAVSAVRTYVQQHRAAFLDDLAEWLRIPSVSAQPDHASDVRRSADWLAARLKETGFPTAEVWQTPGAPAVYAEWPSDDPGAPTVLVYGHHDVQPAAREDGWDSEPFEPVVRGNRLYARGAADDKGQVFFHTLGVRAHLATTGRTAPAVHLKLLIEGEEESGSPHFRALVEQHADRLAADAVIVSDTGMWSEDTPTVCTGMRGLAECEIRLYGPDQDIHSGSFGGAVPNPATAAARLVAALHDEHARVAIPGFYDGVVELTDRERELFAELPFDEQQWLRTAKSHGTLGEAGYSTLERIWARPTAEVNGIGGGYQGPGSKTIVPSSAMVKLSFRLVAGQDPEQVAQAVRDWVPGQVPDGIRHEIAFSPATRPCLTPLDHPALQSVVRAMSRAFDAPVRFTREGGSGPAADLQDVLGAPVLFLGISVPSDGWHAPNEKVELDLLLKGVETSAYLWGDLAEHWRHAT
ncbi:dipeptidase [Streptomyces calvus]|uniref:dipeptidase n=1 Tax=Streptomyces calvus TaxID=67282 RepID=UPI00370F852E